jgi:hypothetical protein
MSRFRDELIRAVFELHREQLWVETLEPKFKERGVDAAAMTEFREAWNQHCEKQDWAWWQNEAKRFSTNELDDMRRDITDKLDAIGVRQSRPNNLNKAASEEQKFDRVLNGALNHEDKRTERSHDHGREM